MRIHRKRASLFVSGLAAVLSLPLHANGADLRRLPPIEFDGSNLPPAQMLSPIPSHSVPRVISQSVWLTDPNQADPSKQPRPVKLVNWNEESTVPPVYVEGEAATSSRKTSAQFISQAPGAAAPAQLPVPPTPGVAPGTSAAAQPLPQTPTPPASEAPPPPDSAASPAIPQLPEEIAPGISNADDDTDCTAHFACAPPPCWYFQTDALLLGRSDVRTKKIVEEGTGTPVRGLRDPLLTTDDLNPSGAWGPRITIGHYLCDVRNIELTYFGLHHWRSVAAFDGINGVGFSFNNIDVPFYTNYTSDFDGAQYISATYSSQIQNAEINLRTNNRWDLNQTTGFPWYNYVDFLAGVRYFRLNEDFDLQATDAGETSDYLTSTSNDLLGGQVGMIVGTCWSERISWNFVSKAGLYVNNASQSTLLRDDNNTVVLRDFNTNDEEMAFIGDSSFSIAYDIRPNLSLSVGYYMLYAGGVALAPEQVDFSTNANSGSFLNQNGSAFYYGATFGLRCNY